MKIVRPDNEELEFTTILENPDDASLFKHFKGKNIYKIITLAKDSETLEEYVIYQKQDDNKPCFCRKKDEFFGEIDHDKYPDLEVKYRCELIKK